MKIQKNRIRVPNYQKMTCFCTKLPEIQIKLVIMIMKIFWIFTIILTFVIMEFVAWFSHKYIMHGFLWSLHRDHHIKDHKSWFERNDFFFIFYAIVSFGFALLWGQYGIWFGYQSLLEFFYMVLLIF